MTKQNKTSKVRLNRETDETRFRRDVISGTKKEKKNLATNIHSCLTEYTKERKVSYTLLFKLCSFHDLN